MLDQYILQGLNPVKLGEGVILMVAFYRSVHPCTPPVLYVV